MRVDGHKRVDTPIITTENDFNCTVRDFPNFTGKTLRTPQRMNYWVWFYFPKQPCSFCVFVVFNHITTKTPHQGVQQNPGVNLTPGCIYENQRATITWLFESVLLKIQLLRSSMIQTSVPSEGKPISMSSVWYFGNDWLEGTAFWLAPTYTDHCPVSMYIELSLIECAHCGAATLFQSGCMFLPLIAHTIVKKNSRLLFLFLVVSACHVTRRFPTERPRRKMFWHFCRKVLWCFFQGHSNSIGNTFQVCSMLCHLHNPYSLMWTKPIFTRKYFYKSDSRTISTKHSEQMTNPQWSIRSAQRALTAKHQAAHFHPYGDFH